MHQLRLSGSEIKHDERPNPRAGQEKRGAYKNIEDVAKKIKKTQLRVHLINTTVLPALAYASETWTFQKVPRFKQVRYGIRSSFLWQRSTLPRLPRKVKQGRPPTRWSDFFTVSFEENYDALRVPRERRNHSATLARDRDKRKNYWRPLERFEGQRESR
ncbi:hypothetical protein RB195_009970 [Necator americanus]|uniref:Endonuclease-reverse transcriptase n=1 Tax=Necator americanus TaxID=51031 RepID=A0ABR1CVS1_NECAM